MISSDAMPTTTLATAEHAPGPVSTKPAILCVDDEPNILNALQRLLHKTGCKILTAPGGEEALAIVQTFTSPAPPGGESPADGLHLALVMSDQRMPRMTGSELLGRVKELAPDCVRILLTGFADVTSAIAAVNTGGAFRYMTKPWETQDLIATVQAGLAHYELIRQNRRLQAETSRQNDELAVLNASLEERVEARTRELMQRNQELTRLSEMLEKDLFESLAVVLRVLEAHNPLLVGHARRVAAHVQKIGSAMGLPPVDIRMMVTASLLHDLGLVGMARDLIERPESMLDEDERARLHQHPRISMETVCHLTQLKPLAPIILAHHERHDGSGYPDGLTGEAIPLGARLLAVADAFDQIVAPGYGKPDPARAQDAVKALQAARGHAFDPVVVDAFLRCLNGRTRPERTVAVKDLEEGMILAEDIHTPPPRNTVLASKNTPLSRALIQRLAAMSQFDGPATIAIVAQPAGTEATAVPAQIRNGGRP